MSAARFLMAATIVIVAVLCTPAALTPGINSADFIVGVAPLVLLFVAWPRRPKTPAGGAAPPNAADTP